MGVNALTQKIGHPFKVTLPQSVIDELERRAQELNIYSKYAVGKTDVARIVLMLGLLPEDHPDIEQYRIR